MSNLYYSPYLKNILSYDEAYTYWLQNSSSIGATIPLISNRRLPNSYFESVSLYPLHFKYVLDNDDPFLAPYQVYEDPEQLDISLVIYEQSEGKYYYPLKSKLSAHHIEEAWNKVKQQRNKLLSEYDWVEKSDIVTDSSKKKVKAFKQLLRDLPSLFKYPHLVVFPAAPKVELIKRKKTRASYYSEKEAESIMDRASVEAIKYWLSIGKPLDKAIVQNILTLY